LPPVTTADTSDTLKNTAKPPQHDAVNSTEISSVSTAQKSDAVATEQLSSKNTDADVEQLPVHSKTRNKEHHHLSNVDTPVTAPAVHQLPPVVQQRPVQYQRAIPLRRINPLSAEKLTVSSSVDSSTVDVLSTSAIQQLLNKSVAAESTLSQLTLAAKSLSDGAVGAIGNQSSAVIGDSSLSLSSRMQHDSQNNRCCPESPESIPFFMSTKSDRIPGICEDIEPDVELRTGRPVSLSHYAGLMSSSAAGSLSVINVVATSSVTTVSETAQKTVALTDTVTSSHVGTSSYLVSDALCLSPCQGSSASMRHSTPQGTMLPTVPSGNSSSVAEGLLPLLSTIATCLFKTPLRPHSTTVPASSTIVSSATTNSIMPAVSSRSSAVTVPELKHSSTTISSSDAVSAWITSLPPSTIPLKPQPPREPSPEPCVELDFDVDAVLSPRSDEIMSFSPPSSEYMMALALKKHTTGIKKKAPKKTTNGQKSPNKPVMVSIKKFAQVCRNVFRLAVNV